MTNMNKNSYEEMINSVLGPCLRVVEHYDCPPECHAACCGNSDISLERFERERILQVHPEVKQIMRTKSREAFQLVRDYPVHMSVFTVRPCPLLTDERCSVNDVKPIVCRLFPITTGKSPHTDHIAVDPCPVGMEIMKDFLLLKCLSMKTALEQDDPAALGIYESDLGMLRIVERDAREYWTSARSQIMYLPLDSMSGLNDFLDTSTREDRLHDRKVFEIDL